jgi:hypothetical protein
MAPSSSQHIKGRRITAFAGTRKYKRTVLIGAGAAVYHGNLQRSSQAGMSTEDRCVLLSKDAGTRGH